MAKNFSEELFDILNKRAVNFSRKHYHTFCGSPHVFLALNSFLTAAEANNDERYTKVKGTLKSILNKYGIEGSIFSDTMKAYIPDGEKPDEDDDFVIQPDKDYERLSSTLKQRSINEGREMQVEDLIFELFSELSFNLFNIFRACDVDGDGEPLGDSKTEEMYHEIQDAFRKESIELESELDDIEELKNLNKWIPEYEKKNGPVVSVGVEDYIKALEMALAGRIVKSAILVGPAGTGKTQVVYELVKRINEGNVPDFLKNKVIYQLDPASLIAGTRYRGDMEEKLKNICNVLKDTPNAIMFIDEIHTIVKMGDGTEGASNVGNLIKPYLSNGEIQVIGATTDDEYSKHIENEKAFASRFHKLLIKEPTKEEVIEILKALLPVETEFFKKNVQEELCARIAKMSYQYTLDKANPRKAIMMLEDACAYARVFEEQKTDVDLESVIESVKIKYNVYITETKYSDTRKALFDKLLSQEDALNQVCKGLYLVDKGIVDPERPLLSLILAGPTGTGKTETCKLIAKHFFGSENALVKLNMSQYRDEASASKINGANPGYVGYDDEPELIKGVKNHPQCVVLFDEIEKAHRSIYTTLLNIIDEGYMTDNKGNKVSFKNTIIVLSTNLGCKSNLGDTVGAGLCKTVVTQKDEEITKALEQYFSPEFLGRLDDTIIYHSLSRDVIETLIERNRKYFNEQSELDVEFTKEDVETIMKKAHIEKYGARDIAKTVRKQYQEIILRDENKKEAK